MVAINNNHYLAYKRLEQQIVLSKLSYCGVKSLTNPSTSAMKMQINLTDKVQDEPKRRTKRKSVVTLETK